MYYIKQSGISISIYPVIYIYIAACISLVKSKGPDTLACSIAFSTAHDAAQLQTTVTNCDLTAMDSGDEELTQCTGAIEPRQLDKPLFGDETSNKDLQECLKMATRFEKVEKKWHKELLIDPEQPSLGSWASGKWITPYSFSVICKPCAQKYGQQPDASPWATGGLKTVAALQLGHARRHGSSFLHQEAIKHLKSGSDDIEEEKPVRNKHELKSALQKTWDVVRKGSSFAAASGDEIGSRSKVARLTRALGTAVQEQDCEALRKAYTIALHQDTREGVLCLRYACASLDSVVVQRGVCGFCHHPGTKSEDIQAGVLSILQDLCGEDDDLLLHICDSVELIDSDGASDEQKSLKLLQDVFVHARFLCRDATHSARRLTRNPWTADRYLNEIIDQYILSADSICSVIHNSPDLRHVFGQHVSGDHGAEVQTIRNLGSSHNRFDSVSKPLGRFVTCFDSVWRTAQQICLSRQDTEPARKANNFLRHACVETLIQCAMLADAAHESIEVIRFHDTEDFDISLAPAVIAQFLHRIDVLFLKQEVVNVGHTKVMLGTLRTERTCVLRPENVMKSLGGAGAVKQEVLDRCFARMANWVRLAGERLEGEFPSWRALHLFEVFNLSNTNGEGMKTQLLQLAEIFGIEDTEALVQQFFHIRINARHRLETGKVTASKDAWRDARLHLHDRRMTHHTCDSLDFILCRYLTFSGNTTSGVEQTFSQTVRCLGPYRQSMKEDLQNHLFRVFLAPSNTCEMVVQKAVVKWIQLFGDFRKHAQNIQWKRLRCSAPLQGVEAEFHRKRQREVEQAGCLPFGVLR